MGLLKSYLNLSVKKIIFALTDKFYPGKDNKILFIILLSINPAKGLKIIQLCTNYPFCDGNTFKLRQKDNMIFSQGKIVIPKGKIYNV